MTKSRTDRFQLILDMVAYLEVHGIFPTIESRKQVAGIRAELNRREHG